MSFEALDSLDFEREVGTEISDEEKRTLELILFDIQSTTFRSDIESLSEEANTTIEAKLQLDAIRQKYRDLATTQFILTVLNDDRFSPYYEERQFELASQWLAHRNTTLMIVPDRKEVCNYYKIHPKHHNRLIEMAQNHPIPVWPIGKKFDFDAQTWRYIAVTKGWYLDSHYVQPNGKINIIDALYDSGYEFLKPGIKSMQMVTFTSANNIPLLRNDLPSANEVQTAYNHKIQKLVYDNQQLELQPNMPVVKGLQKFAQLSEEDIWRYDISRNVAILYSLRNTNDDGIIDWQDFDNTLQTAKQIHDFVSNVEPTFFSKKAVKEYFEMENNWGIFGALFAEEKEKKKWNKLLNNKDVKTVRKFASFLGVNTLSNLRKDLSTIGF